jgi:hypothetical protein
MILLSLRGGTTKQSQDWYTIDFRDCRACNDKIRIVITKRDFQLKFRPWMKNK